MPGLENDLLLLMLSLSRMHDRETILRLFVEAMSAAREGAVVRPLADGEAPTGEVLEIATPESRFGRLVLEDPGGVVSKQDRARYRNAVRMLAVVLENISRAERLATENARLDAAVAVRTEELQRAAERTRDLYDHAPCGYFSLGPDGRFVQVNDTMLRWLGYDRQDLLHRMRFVDLLTPESQPVFRRESARFRETAMAVHEAEVEVVRKDGTHFPAIASATAVRAPDGTFLMSRANLVDLSERRRAERALRETEERFRQSQKLEAIGRLAGGVAHDFNNLLTVILSCADALLDGLPPDHPLRQDVADIDDAGRKASQLTRQLLAFGRRHGSNPAPVDLGAIAAGMEKMLRRLIGEDVELLVSSAPGLPLVYADPAQLEQVVLNLVVNARDAMPKGGRITVETSAVGAPGDSGAARVRLAVSDTGVGMAEEVRAHLFEPFFTTKREGRGTGLGLATVYGIVKQANGDIRVESEPGQGSRFEVLLPVSGHAAAGPGEVHPEPEELLRGHETVLLVEDDPRVRAVAGLALRRAGYAVLEAPNGEAALELARGTDHLDVLVTDLVMPRLGGADLAARLQAERPDLPVVFMSGYARQAQLPDAGAGGVLQKPFTAATLTRAIRERLEARREPAPPAARP
jgi:PAS domain S-box-containing protein